ILKAGAGMRVFSLSSLLSLAVAVPACGGGGHHGGGAAAGGGASSAGASAAPTAQSPPAPTYPVRAGAARSDCTPPIGAPIGGFGGGPRRPLDASTIPLNIAAALGIIFKANPNDYNTLFAPSQGKHDAISAKALVLEKNGERFAILSLDFIGVSRKAPDQLAAPAHTGAGVAPDHRP